MKQFIWKDCFMIGINGVNADSQEFVIYANDISLLAVQNAGYATKRHTAQPQYIYFQAKNLGNESTLVLLQLLNPNNSQAIKCYFDPTSTPNLSKNNVQNVNHSAYYIDNGTTFQHYEKYYFFAQAKPLFNYCERMGSFLIMEWERLPQYLARYQDQCY
jgi:hypothetical protein